jgi:hypothetical protein
MVHDLVSQATASGAEPLPGQHIYCLGSWWFFGIQLNEARAYRAVSRGFRECRRRLADIGARQPPGTDRRPPGDSAHENSERVIEMAGGTSREPEPTTAFNVLPGEEAPEVAGAEKPTETGRARAAAEVTEEEASSQPAVEVDPRPLAQRFLESRD